jgi:hypothetical protein
MLEMKPYPASVDVYTIFCPGVYAKPVSTVLVNEALLASLNEIVPVYVVW